MNLLILVDLVYNVWNVFTFPFVYGHRILCEQPLYVRNHSWSMKVLVVVNYSRVGWDLFSVFFQKSQRKKKNLQYYLICIVQQIMASQPNFLVTQM
ncbi:hypothetical protein GDO81_016293 [Engystomops pustulosus]|uniref:Secreted protein n=1 Tax=Engystomops pustulosus TaxID=76066 RepID=A0AAV7AVC4_ENGPU|nr:hypothetical protein GDO81_016293 [Engystomops pustulosus]